MNSQYKDDLKSVGVDVDTALDRVVGNEDLYEKLLLMFFDDDSFDALKTSFAKGDIDGAFNAAHTIKGTAGDLGLDNITEIIFPMVEVLRAGKSDGVGEMIDRVQERYDELKGIVCASA